MAPDELTINNTWTDATLIDKNGVYVPGFATPFTATAGATGPYVHLTRKEVPNGFVSDYNTLAVVNFDTNRISVNIVFVQYGYVRPTVWGQATYSNVGFTLAPGAVSGAQKIIGVLPATTVNGVQFPSQPFTATVVPVNGGKTLLVQGTGNPFSGVCQF